MAPKRRYGLAIATAVALAGAAGAQPLPPANIPNAPPPPPNYQPQPQQFPQQQQQPQQQFQSNSSATCQRLEAALAQVNRGPAGANNEQLARYEDAIVKQRQELDQAMGTARRLGCDRRGFFIFGGSQRPEQCNALEPQIDRMRANLDRMQQEVSQLRGGNSDANYTRDLQRRQILVSLNQNNCGPQYRNVAVPQQRPRGFLDRLFGNTDENPDVAPNDIPMEGQGFRTVCVRMCDGAFFPISFATVQSRFGEDEALCKRQCPAAEVALYAYNNPGQDIQQAVSLSGQLYSSLPNAFKYRTEFNPSCSCRGPGQSWADALGQDQTIQRGDIIVTEQRSKQLSQPKIGPLAPQQQPTQQTKNPNTPVFEPPTPTPTSNETLPPEKPDAKRKVRVVGPQFYPVRPIN
jgi:outer membrane biosynthesis protein TonB